MAWVIAGLNNSIKISIRSKLLLISAVLFVVPWIGVQYVQDMENFLRDNQEQNLIGRAQIVAAVLQGQEDIFKSRTHSSQLEEETIQTIENSSHLYVRPLKRMIQLDGYMDDWLDFEEKSKLVVMQKNKSLEYRYYLASYRKYLYMVIKVKDDKLIYRKENSLSLDKNDHLLIKLRNKEGDLRTYIVATQSPGWVNAHRMSFRNNEWQSVAPELRIKGEWQETADGYNLEIRLPLALIGDGFSFFIADVDDRKNREIKNHLGESEINGALGSIIIPSVKVEEMLKRIERPASRTWVIDKKYRVLAVSGNLKNTDNRYNSPSSEQGAINIITNSFYRFFLKQPSHKFKDELSSASYLRNKAVKTALKGEVSANWRDTPDKSARILTVSYPVIVNNETIGVIAIEETSNAILILQNKAMEILINLSVLTFFITVIILLSYATRLSIRIRRLRNEAEEAISNEGRIEGIFSLTKSTDEIGDLSRSFNDMLARLAEYNRYLETMAGKLSHELRTPITVVRSSLENLQMADTEESRETYIKRASEGMARLSDILTRMSEATRLEQTLQSETRIDINFIELINSCVGGYKLAYPDIEIKFEVNLDNKPNIAGVPELIAQMLDKLISNAVDFHVDATAIIIRINKVKDAVQLSVINQGKKLPEEMRDNLFESMVSVRAKKGVQPHLGLGLYIVRMIVEFHRGDVRAVNLDDGSGVEVLVEFPVV